jgi:hypothetical protein
MCQTSERAVKSFLPRLLIIFFMALVDQGMLRHCRQPAQRAAVREWRVSARDQQQLILELEILGKKFLAKENQT